jgi:hypothetical protein
MTHGGRREGAGRKPGSRPRKSLEIASLVQAHEDVIIAELIRLAEKSRSDTIRVGATCELLDRSCGRAPAPAAVEMPPTITRFDLPPGFGRKPGIG